MVVVIEGDLGVPVTKAHVPQSCSSCARNWEMGGRLGGVDSCCSYHDCTSNLHNTSENPTVGRSGRSPRITCTITRGSVMSSNGRRCVTTYKRSHESQRDYWGMARGLASYIVIPSE